MSSTFFRLGQTGNAPNEFDVGAGSAFTRHMAYHGQKEAKNHYNYGQLGISSGFSKYCLQQSIRPEFAREVWV